MLGGRGSHALPARGTRMDYGACKGFLSGFCGEGGASQLSPTCPTGQRVHLLKNVSAENECRSASSCKGIAAYCYSCTPPSPADAWPSSETCLGSIDTTVHASSIDILSSRQRVRAVCTLFYCNGLCRWICTEPLNSHVNGPRAQNPCSAFYNLNRPQDNLTLSKESRQL